MISKLNLPWTFQVLLKTRKGLKNAVTKQKFIIQESKDGTYDVRIT